MSIKFSSAKDRLDIIVDNNQSLKKKDEKIYLRKEMKIKLKRIVELLTIPENNSKKSLTTPIRNSLGTLK